MYFLIDTSHECQYLLASENYRNSFNHFVQWESYKIRLSDFSLFPLIEIYLSISIPNNNVVFEMRYP